MQVLVISVGFQNVCGVKNFSILCDQSEFHQSRHSETDAEVKYSNYVMELKERNGIKAKTLVRYREMLKRINAEIAPIKLQDLRAEHLNRLYAKLAQRATPPKLPKHEMKTLELEDVKAILMFLPRATRRPATLWTTYSTKRTNPDTEPL